MLPRCLNNFPSTLSHYYIISSTWSWFGSYMKFISRDHARHVCQCSAWVFAYFILILHENLHIAPGKTHCTAWKPVARAELAESFFSIIPAPTVEEPTSPLSITSFILWFHWSKENLIHHSCHNTIQLVSCSLFYLLPLLKTTRSKATGS